jgi:glutamate racemase
VRIGIFDSGMGGLTVLKSLIDKYPNNHYIYFGDTLNMPYGNKSIEELQKLSSRIVEFLIAKKVDVIIIACGTISSNCYSYLKEKYSIPIYDILTPTIDYLKNNDLKNTCVIATTNTIKSGIFNDITDNQVECPLFVPLIENGKINSDEMKNAIESYLNGKKIDNLVLGCTHYPLLKSKLTEYLGDINYINMGDVLASSLVLDDEYYALDLYFSKINDNIRNLCIKLFEDYEMKEV